jgi:hypothetical protein
MLINAFVESRAVDVVSDYLTQHDSCEVVSLGFRVSITDRIRF